MDGVSVIICCYNSAARLPETLKHLALQQVHPPLAWEVLIIDNASTDDTGFVAVAEWKKFNVSHVNLTVVRETEPGLSAARERGIKESAYEYLIFCDDDNWLDKMYVQQAWTVLNQHPAVAAVGGINEGVFENNPPPEWFPYFAHGYAVCNQGQGAFEILEGDKYIVGAGMSFRKSAYEMVKQKGFKFYLTDRIGNKVVGGGDVELCYLFKLAGFSIAFSDKLRLKHYMPAGRITKKYLVNMWRQHPQSFLILEGYKYFLGNKTAGLNTSSEQYWKNIAGQRLVEKAKMAPKYLYLKLKGFIIFYLTYETAVAYNIYLYRNSKKLVSIINELGSKI
jgi:glycosyltransferase involved in cell wall biosynthesis